MDEFKVESGSRSPCFNFWLNDEVSSAAMSSQKRERKN